MLEFLPAQMTLLGSELDFWKRFCSGTSPKRLLRHPAVWSVDRVKCFILDIADARFDLQIEGPIQKCPRRVKILVESLERPIRSSSELGRFYGDRGVGSQEFNMPPKRHITKGRRKLSLSRGILSPNWAFSSPTL